MEGSRIARRKFLKKTGLTTMALSLDALGFLGNVAHAEEILDKAEDVPGGDRRFALIFVIDGAPNDQFNKMLEGGELPNFKKHIYDRGVHSNHHMTVFPPLTFPAMASIFSGYHPLNHGIPTYFWVDRERGRYKNYLSVNVGEYKRDFAENAKFIFEYFPEERTVSFGLPLALGADHKRDLGGSFVDVFREGRDLDYITKAVEQEHTISPDILFKPGKFLSLFNPAGDANVISLANPLSQSGFLRHTLDTFTKFEGEMEREVPKVVLYYDWATSRLSYHHGPDSPEVRRALIEADAQFGRMVDAYEKAGLYERTYFMLLSDHGNMPLEPKYVRMDEIFFAEGFKVAYISHELIARARLTGLLRAGSVLKASGSVEGNNCMLGTAGGGSVTVFLSKDGGTGTDSWKQEVYYRDLLRYPVAEDKKLNVVELINSIEGVNCFLVREDAFLPGKPHVTRVVSPRGSALVSARFEDNRLVELKYEVIEGKDPFGYSEIPALAEMISSGYHGERDWLRATAATAYPDAPAQIAQIMELDRTGSIIILPDDRHSFHSYVWSKHGALSAEEMHALFAVSGPGLRHGGIQYSRAIDVLPTFLHLMGKEISPEDFDGIVLPLTR